MQLCGTNPAFLVLATIACLGVVFGFAGRSSNGPRRATAGVVVSVCALLVMLAMIMSTLVRVRGMSDESMQIGELRTVAAAQAAYQSASGGSYDTLECLSAPSRCLPDYPANGPSFLDPAALARVRYGFSRSFHPAEAAPGARSRSALMSFAYVAVPVVPGRTGCRGYCVDSEGTFCQTDGRMPRLVRGLCDKSEGSGCTLPE